MKFPFLFLVFLLLSCNNSQNNKLHQDNTFNWLLGSWQRSMSGDSVLNHNESWEKGLTSYNGLGATNIDGKITLEHMTLVKSYDRWTYEAHPEQNEKATSFVVTDVRDSFFRCENNQHDFPKYIEYLRRNDSLFASIGDEKQRITFAFRKQVSKYE